MSTHPSEEVQPSGANATALHRVHLIIQRPGRPNPESFRTAVMARGFDEAWGAATARLRRHAQQHGWGQVTVLSYGSCEKVPTEETQ